MLTKVGLGLSFLLLPWSAFAQMTSYHFVNPVGMMYDLPVGEPPGWSSDRWVNFEVSAANIWNHQFSMTDIRNGNIYSYFADYEQETVVADMGFALTPNLAISLEVPYENHNGGFMDDAVDRFHQWIESDRFMRDVSPKFGNHFQVQTNGVDNLTTEHAEGIGNFKAKLKYWFLHVNSPTPGECDCGLAVSGQVKFPVQDRAHGLSSGTNDYSELIHAGLPLGSESAMWATAAFTQLGSNDTFAGWPQNKFLQMYELSFDFGSGPNLGFMIQARYESPLFNPSVLSFNYTSSTPSGQLEERVSSGWNALTDWRGSESIGVRWRWGNGNQFNFLFVEDWAIGAQDQTTDGLYINDAPDFEIVTQWHLVF
jgi:hypothetical protein